MKINYFLKFARQILPLLAFLIIFILMLIPNMVLAQNDNGSIDAPGDIAFVAFHDNRDGFSFILLDDAPNGTIISFIDEELSGGVFVGTGESELIWQVSGSTIVKGTVIDVYDDIDNVWKATAGTLTENNATQFGNIDYGNFTTGIVDQVYALTGPVTGTETPRSNPTTFLAFIGNTAPLPASLTEGTTALTIVGERYYSGTINFNGSLSATVAAINSSGSWTDFNGGGVTFHLGVTNTFTGSVFSSATTPTVTTTAASSISTTTATLGGNVTSNGGETVDERGIVWNTSINPTTSNNKVSNGSGINVFSGTVSSLPASSVIYYRAFAKNSVGTSYGSELSFTTYATEPTVAASTITQSLITATSMTVGWTNGNGARRIVIAKSGSAVSTDPIDGNGYTANTSFGSGTDLGSSNFIVYDGTGTSVSLTGLTAGTTYHFKVLEYNGTSATSNYFLTGAPTGNRSTISSEPTVAASTITQSSITATSMTVGWTNGNGARRIVIAKSESAVSTDPIDGNGYTANAAFGSGTDLGSGNFIVYDGTGTSFSLSALTAGTTYHFKVIEFNGTSSSANYFITAAPTGNQATTDPTVTLGLSGSPLAENGGVATITATLNTVSSKNVTVTIAPTGTATGTDYTLSSTTITINAGATSGTATITGADDVLDESAETVIIDITGVTNGTESGTQQVTASITDDDAAPSVTLSLSGSAVAENGGVATITASLNTASGQNVIVTIDPSGTAIGSNMDYILSSSTISIAAGTTSGTATITSADDALDESNETVIIDITGVSNGTESATQQVTATIIDDDDVPMVAFASTTSSGLESVSSKDLQINLSAASSKTITVAYAVSGTATATDYTLANGTVTFSPSQTSKTITIESIINDLLDEIDETVIITLSSPSNATLGTNTAHTYTITDNDPAPTVTLGLSGSPLAENGGVATITATLNTASSKNVTVTIAPTGTATGTDYTLSSTTITINAGATSGTATITGANDAIDESAETVIIDITGVTNATESGTQQVTASITDDDAAPAVTLSLSGSSVSENGGIATITASLNTASGQEVAVTIEATGTATGIDYNLSSTTITIPAGSTSGTATITGVYDALDEGNETVVIDITGVSNATESGTQQVTATITDELKTPSITFTSILKTYGDANFVLGATSNSIGAITYTIVPGGTGMATLSGVSNEIVTLGNAGTVTIRASQAADGSFTSGTKDVTLTINKALLIVDATDATKVYGDENPLFWFNYLTTSFKNGDTHTALTKYPQTNTTATKTSNVGTEIITVSGGEADNYDFSYTSAILTITKAPLTATADISREYGDVNPVFTIAYVGFKNSETASVLDAAPIASTTATTTTNVGAAVITLSGGTDNNYTVTSNNGILTINKALLTAIADDKSKDYGEANPDFTISYTGFKNGDDATELDTAPVVSSTATLTTSAGDVDIDITQGSDANYTITGIKGTLTILVVIDDSPPTTAKLVPATAFTPNGDGINDNWIIPGIKTYANSSVMVYNRNGHKVFEAKSYQNNWGGTYKSEGKLPTGSYYYVIDLGNGSKPLVGWIFINY